MSALTSEDALQGNLRDFPLRSLLESLANRGRSGALVLEGGCEIWFSSGEIYLASSESGASPTSIVFSAADGVPLSDVKAMFGAAESELSVIDQVVARRPESEPVLRRLLHEYNLNCLFEMLVPAELEFSFESGRVHRLGDAYAMNTVALLDQAERRVEIWRRIASRIPSTSAVFRLAERLPDRALERTISSDEWRYLAQLDGKRTVAEIITGTGESAFRVCSVLYRLLMEGVVIGDDGEALKDTVL